MNRCLFLMSFALFCGVAAPVLAQQFRVASEVFDDNDSKPIVETLTLFQNGVAYDFQLTGSQLITLVDPRRERLVLLDPDRRLQTTVKMRDLSAHIERLRQQGAQGKGAWFFNPTFKMEETTDGYLNLNSSMLKYRVKGEEPKAPQAVQQYQRFADWSARLNFTPRTMPPFARIELDRILAERGEMPVEVELTLTLGPLNPTLVRRSKHSVIWSLSKTDRQRIENVGEHMARFESVAFQDFYSEKAAAK